MGSDGRAKRLACPPIYISGLLLFDPFAEKIGQHCTPALQRDWPAQLATEPILDALVRAFRYLNTVGQTRGLQTACDVDRISPDIVDGPVLTDQASDRLPGVDAYPHFEHLAKALPALTHDIDHAQRHLGN